MAPLSTYEEFRRAVSDLNFAARIDLRELWAAVNGDIFALQELIPELLRTYGEASATLAAQWYDDLRAESGVAPGFTAQIPDPRAPGTNELLGWAMSEARTVESFQSLVEGGFERRLTDYSRDVVMQSAVADPRARGWMRVGAGRCDFCAMLIGRGAVYTENTVRFASHDRCKCSVAPAFNPDQVKSVNSEFVASARNRSDASKSADAERARQWIETNVGGSGAGNDGAPRKSSAPVPSKDTPSDVANRQLPGMNRSLADLRAKGLPEDSPQIRYHMEMIRRYEGRL